MMYDYMCSDCGIEYTVDVGPNEEPEPRCPACNSKDAVGVFAASTEPSNHGSWESREV